MSAAVRVDSGVSAGTKYWIDRPVLRIGSDPGCEICLPSAELAAHALTLEFRDGVYRVYNRSPAPVAVGGAIVKPGGLGAWSADQAVQLPGVQLALEIDGDPRPTPRIDQFEAEEDSPHATAPGPSTAAEVPDAKKKSGAMLQLAIIGVCGIATGAFLLLGRGGASAPTARVSFEDIVTTSLTEPAETRAIVRRLQYAQSALVRGNTKAALERFSKLRDQLVASGSAEQTPNLPAKQLATVEKVRAYVEYRLGQLQ